MNRLMSALVLVLLPGTLLAETVHLKDGSLVKGTVVGQTRTVLTLDSGNIGKVEIPVEKIARIEYEDVPATAAAAPKARVEISRPAAAPAPTPECKMGTDGINACGYHCRMGTDGRVACADTADGTCAMNTKGRITCTRLAGVAPAEERASWPVPERRLNSDGTHATGYNCRLGSNGRWYCSSRPDGDCRMNSNGTFTCP